eukprot:scaffold22084_cov117-Isochrysis_galbana.AAC.6
MAGRLGVPIDGRAAAPHHSHRCHTQERAQPARTYNKGRPTTKAAKNGYMGVGRQQGATRHGCWAADSPFLATKVRPLKQCRAGPSHGEAMPEAQALGTTGGEPEKAPEPEPPIVFPVHID